MSPVPLQCHHCQALFQLSAVPLQYQICQALSQVSPVQLQCPHIVRLLLNCLLFLFNIKVIRLSLKWILLLFNIIVVRLSLNLNCLIVRLSFNCLLFLFNIKVVRLSQVFPVQLELPHCQALFQLSAVPLQYQSCRALSQVYPVQLQLPPVVLQTQQLNLPDSAPQLGLFMTPAFWFHRLLNLPLSLHSHHKLLYRSCIFWCRTLLRWPLQQLERLQEQPHLRFYDCYLLHCKASFPPFITIAILWNFACSLHSSWKLCTLITNLSGMIQVPLMHWLHTGIEHGSFWSLIWLSDFDHPFVHTTFWSASLQLHSLVEYYINC